MDVDPAVSLQPKAPVQALGAGSSLLEGGPLSAAAVGGGRDAENMLSSKKAIETMRLMDVFDLRITGLEMRRPTFDTTLMGIESGRNGPRSLRARLGGQNCSERSRGFQPPTGWIRRHQLLWNKHLLINDCRSRLTLYFRDRLK
jgi:hypothetical protein